MAQSLRHIKRRIRSIENTQKITNAMKLISVSKLRSVQGKVQHASYYFERVGHLLESLAPQINELPHPLLVKRQPVARIVLCVVASDTGLCGNYNQNIFRVANQFILNHPGAKISIFGVGKRTLNYFKKRGLPMVSFQPSENGRYSLAMAERLTAEMQKIFLSNQADEMVCIYTSFTAARYQPVVEKIFPLERPVRQEADYLLEPDAPKILDNLLPVFVQARIAMILLNAFACEHSARSIAMGEATDNAKELLKDLILLRNKIRQANITRELIEVISTSEALKG